MSIDVTDIQRLVVHPGEALLVRGEFWLTVDGVTRHLQAGDRFAVVRGTPHVERYGAAGATFWVARRGGT